MLATIASATVSGVEGRPVAVEVHVSTGLPGFTIVGLPDTPCRESRDRVRAAVLSSGLTFPQQRVTVNLAPSDVRKAGTGLDLAIAIGLLVASDQLPAASIEQFAFIGELGLDGTIRPVAGALPMSLVVDAATLVVPRGNTAEAQLIGRHDVRAPGTLAELVEALRGEGSWPRVPEPPAPELGLACADLADVRGQAFPRRALEVAAAGGHHLLMVGPPGGGKTMLAERLPGLLGPLDDAAALRATVAASAAGQPLPAGGLVRLAPFRSPHHSSSLVSIVGGGSHALRPGEITLASDGVLFLDELGEFSAAVLDALRQPLEQRRIHIARAHAHVELPADFLLVAATNPCPCGFAPAPSCRCTEANLARYHRRISGPILDRLDLRVLVNAPGRSELFEQPPGEPTATVAARVAAARARAAERGVSCNARLDGRALARHSTFDADGRRLLERAVDRGRLSGRGVARVRGVALTLDDLRGGSGQLDADVVAEALALRTDLDFLHHVGSVA